MMKLRILAIICGVLSIGALVFLSIATIANKYLHTQNQNKIVAGPCPTIGRTHSVTITNGIARPRATSAALCDTLHIINRDNQLRLVAFGEHDKHQLYDGVSEKALEKGQTLAVVLNQTGTFVFHDHLTDDSAGSFTVAR
jgi:hypothetical protein